MSQCGVLIVGGGPAGLAAALELRRLGIDDVVVIEREQSAGGVPRHSNHQGFGLRDLHRSMSGPRYAQRYVDLASRSLIQLCTEAMVTGWDGGTLEVTSPAGRERYAPRALLLATGCRERPRAARLVPGSRAEGVLTTGLLQRLVYSHVRSPGKRALVVGAEHVSFSALQTLAHGGTRSIGMVTQLPRHQSLAMFRLGAAVRYRAPIWTRTSVAAIYGQPRVEAVELRDLDTGHTWSVECDTVVFTADWAPDNELAALGGIELDPGTRGPAVDGCLRTSRVGVFACGNLIHAAEPADVAALSGRHVATHLAAHLINASAWPAPRVPITCTEPLHWIAPNVVTSPRDRPPRGCFLLRSGVFVHRPALRIEQDARTLWHGRLSRLVPGRSARIPCSWTTQVDPAGGPINVTLARSPASRHSAGHT